MGFLNIKLMTALTNEATQATNLDETERNLRLWGQMDQLRQGCREFPELADDICVALYNNDCFQEALDMVNKAMSALVQHCVFAKSLGLGEESTVQALTFA